MVTYLQCRWMDLLFTLILLRHYANTIRTVAVL